MPKRILSSLSPEIIRHARLTLDKKQIDFAELMQISQGKLSKLENGRLRPDTAFEQRLYQVMQQHAAALEKHLVKNLEPLLQWLHR